MKNAIWFLVVIAITQFNCGNEHANGGATASNTTSSADTHEAKQGNGIVGEWELTLLARDDNGNSKLDEEERKNAFTQAQNKDYLKLNSDGSALFSQAKVKGRYELKPQSGGRNKLVLYDRNNNDENRGVIYSVTDSELILFKAGSTFSVYKRL